MTGYALLTLIVVIVIIVLALLIFWIQVRQGKAAQAKGAQTGAAAPAPDTTLAPDDLKRIEGIGPKISGVLQSSGINTFALLAKADVSRLKNILEEAGVGALADPTTWPEQAGLAAAGKWDELNTLQDELKGGRRV
jgi:predicted flap endonuclease-1-like 5' DNA nuclease